MDFFLIVVKDQAFSRRKSKIWRQKFWEHRKLFVILFQKSLKTALSKCFWRNAKISPQNRNFQNQSKSFKDIFFAPPLPSNLRIFYFFGTRPFESNLKLGRWKMMSQNRFWLILKISHFSAILAYLQKRLESAVLRGFRKSIMNDFRYVLDPCPRSSYQKF